MKRDFFKAVWNRFELEGVGLKAVLSIEELRAFVINGASCGDGSDVEASEA